MASKDVGKYLLHTEVMDSGCEVHIADERDLPGYEIKHSVDSRAGRGFKVADGAHISNKGEASLQFEVDGEQGQVHELISSFQVAKVSKPFRSVSMIADAGFDILFTKTHAAVKGPKSGRSYVHTKDQEVCTWVRCVSRTPCTRVFGGRDSETSSGYAVALKTVNNHFRPGSGSGRRR